MASGLMKVVAFIMRLIESIWHFFGTLASGSNNLENGIQINVELCKRLDWKIGKSRRRHIKRRDVELSDTEARIVRKLKRAMKRGEDLLRQCKCKGTRSWLYSAVTLMNITEDVLDIELKLGWCSALLKVIRLKGSILQKKKEAQELRARYEKLLKGSESLYEAAAEDAECLESKRKDEMQMHAKGTEQHLLVVYLLTRLKHGRGDCDIPVEDIDLLDTHFQKAVEIQKCLGRGANGAVYAATWLKSHKWVVKVLFEANERRPEATFLQSCNHPNIIRYIWSWQQDSDMGKRVPHILMERMHMDLETLIAQKKNCNQGKPPFEWSEAIDLMVQIAKAVRYLHGNKVYIDGKKSKITHRDLKPKNLLVDEDDEGNWKVKLGDFGISKVYQGTKTLTPLTYRQGTNVYTAPEVWLYEEDGEKFKFSPKADVWSFAMICSEILTGDPPFLGISKSELHVKIKEEGLRPMLPNNLSIGFRRFFAQCWHLDPKKRPTFEDICKHLICDLDYGDVTNDALLLTMVQNAS